MDQAPAGEDAQLADSPSMQGGASIDKPMFGGGSGGTWGSGRLRNLTPGGLSKRWAGLGYGKPRVV